MPSGGFEVDRLILIELGCDRGKYAPSNECSYEYDIWMGEKNTMPRMPLVLRVTGVSAGVENPKSETNPKIRRRKIAKLEVVGFEHLVIWVSDLFSDFRYSDFGFPRSGRRVPGR